MNDKKTKSSDINKLCGCDVKASTCTAISQATAPVRTKIYAQDVLAFTAWGHLLGRLRYMMSAECFLF